jgi:hypothetical protein
MSSSEKARLLKKQSKENEQSPKKEMIVPKMTKKMTIKQCEETIARLKKEEEVKMSDEQWKEIMVKIDREIDGTILFASTTDPFDMQKLADMIHAFKEDLISLSQIKIYIRSYFTTLFCGNGEPSYCFWDAYKKNFIKLGDTTLRTYLPESFDIYYEIKKKKHKFSCCKFVKTEIFEKFRFDVDFSNKKTYMKDNQYFINLFEGFLHENRENYTDYPEHIKKAVDDWWNHVKVIWCSNNEEQFKYTKKWLCAFVSGQKMTTALYLRSSEGTGKTIFCDFLRNKVIGEKICFTLENTKCISGGFNASLYGKLLVVCEEMPSNTDKEWKSLVSWMKPWITNRTKQFEAKFGKEFNAKNVSSFIILTNSQPFALSHDDRRYVMLDVSNKYIGNHKYFNHMANHLEGPYSDIIGEAFYWYCIKYNELYVKKHDGKPFNPQFNKPITVTKQVTIIEHLHTFYIYIKRHFLSRKKGLEKELLKNFRDDYLKALTTDATRKKLNMVPYYKNHNTDISSRKISDLLKDIGIETKNGTGNHVYVPKISYDDLNTIYNNRHWLDDYDDENESSEEEISEEAPAIEFKKSKKIIGEHPNLKFLEKSLEPTKKTEDKKSRHNPVSVEEFVLTFK